MGYVVSNLKLKMEESKAEKILNVVETNLRLVTIARMIHVWRVDLSNFVERALIDWTE